jgi:hypothetical protein
LEDTRFTKQNIYILYIDFKNAFGSLDHARLLAVIKDLGYPENAVTLIGNFYSQSNTIFTGEHFGRTKPIPIQKDTIQGRRHAQSIFISNIFGTITKMATKGKKWIHTWYI